MGDVKVISLGGSIVAPKEVDTGFIRSFAEGIRRYCGEEKDRRLIFVIGGGGPARAYQQAYREIVDDPDSNDQDWIGIAATRINAALIRAVFSDLCHQEVVIDPTEVHQFVGTIMVAAGWKPGFSTDYDAVILAERFGAEVVINLSNIAKVYTADPKTDPQATPIDSISWADFRKLVGDEWVPGKNSPFDPVASKRAAELGLKVICADGKDLKNLDAILREESFVGTVIGPN